MNDYLFADRTAENERLLAQSRLLDPLTRRLLTEAGLAPGMRVLDLGSGAGNVSMLAAELVGPDGAVLGVERDPAAVELARRNTAATNVEYQVGDVQTLDGVPGEFDAVVGRLILMYQQDPVEALRQAAKRVRSGGLVCMHEGDMSHQWAWPLTPLWKQLREWALETCIRTNMNICTGPQLYGMFRAAGIPGPQLVVEGNAGGGADAPTWGWVNAAKVAAPMMEKLGVVSMAELDLATLADRLAEETIAVDGYVLGPLLTGAWSVVD